ncbi:ATP/GTP-binding protein [Streptomyces griseus]|uniref:ATP/GTP-binding protein n=1 Tax=Streptomyces griseus TaxID=1911 RepID=UPI00364EEC50
MGRGGSKGDGSGKDGSKGDRSGRGGSKGEGGRRQDAPASPRAERARARRERAAARQAARDQRRSTDQAARIADRTKDRDQERAAGQAAREERRRAKAERKAARRAKREAAKTGGGRTTLGAAVAQEAQRRWDERRAAEKDKVEKDSTSGEDSGTTDKKEPQGGSGPAADGSKDAPKTGQADQAEPGGQQTADEPGKQGPGQGPGSSGEAGSDSSKGGWGWWKKKPEPPEGDEPGSAPGGQARPGDGGPYRDVFGQEDPQYTTDRPDRPDTNPGSGHRSDAAAPRADDDEVVVEAVIVEDPGDPFGADRVRRPGLTTGAPGLPPAPEKHTQRPGTSRSADTSTKGDSVSSGHVSKPSGGSGSLAAQHRTDITFGGFLMEMAATALKASSDQERAEALAEALGKVADALREMAGDLVGDHNITTEVTDLIADLADSAGRMKEQARRCAEQCGLAREAVALVATQVARVYGQDMAAKRDAGLKHTSAAAHHD